MSGGVREVRRSSGSTCAKSGARKRPARRSASARAGRMPRDGLERAFDSGFYRTDRGKSRSGSGTPPACRPQIRCVVAAYDSNAPPLQDADPLTNSSIANRLIGSSRNSSKCREHGRRVPARSKSIRRGCSASLADAIAVSVALEGEHLHDGGEPVGLRRPARGASRTSICSRFNCSTSPSGRLA